MLDYIFGAVILVSVIRCIFKGFVAEVIAVAALGGGIICGILFSGPGAAVIARGLGESSWNRVIAFLVIFIGVYLGLKILEGILYRFLDAVNLENLDRALGFFLGIIEGAVVCVLIILVLVNQPFFNTGRLVDDSFFAGIVLDILPAIGGQGIDISAGVVEQGV